MSTPRWVTLWFALWTVGCSEQAGTAAVDDSEDAAVRTRAPGDDAGARRGNGPNPPDDEDLPDAGAMPGDEPTDSGGAPGTDPTGSAGGASAGTGADAGSGGTPGATGGGGASGNGGLAGGNGFGGGGGLSGGAGNVGTSGGAGSGGASSGGGGAGGFPGGGTGGVGVPTVLVSVSATGTGAGRVVSEPYGLDCDVPCGAEFEVGSTVTLSAEPLPGSRFLGFSGDCSGPSCTLRVDEGRSVVAEFQALPSEPPNVAFVTSTTTTGNMGGLAGADQMCAERALAAGLSGTFVAWLSSSEANAIDRLAGAGGWLRTDGKPFANDPRGPIYHPLALDEFGSDIWVGSALTGTNAGGTVTPEQTCEDWTVALGSAGAGALHTTTVSWTTYYGGDTCVYPTHIYCFGIDAYADVTPSSSSDRLAFLSDGTFSPGGGIAAADALCAGEASAHGETGTFKALLATGTASPLSRFSVSGQTWVRPDGVEIVASPAALFPAAEGRILDAPINLTLSGEYMSAYEFVWTGIGAFSDGRSMQTPGVVETTCDSWQSSSPNAEGATGYAADTNLPFGVNGNVNRSCDLALRLYCLEDE